jgi:Icc-related predicted phosphoesterase
MKIGIISDIHTDIEALQIALDRFDNFHNVDLILCAGDMTGYGNEQNANIVVELISSRDILTVKGNHDSPSDGITTENAEFLRGLKLHCNQSMNMSGCSCVMADRAFLLSAYIPTTLQTKSLMYIWQIAAQTLSSPDTLTFPCSKK